MPNEKLRKKLGWQKSCRTRKKASLDVIHSIVSEAMTAGMAAVQAVSCTSFQDDIKKQMAKLTAKINWKILLERCSRGNNIRIYGFTEDAEGTSAVAFVENPIKAEVGDDFAMDQGSNGLGTKHCHSVLPPKPPVSAPPHFMVIWFLQYSVKVYTN